MQKRIVATASLIAAFGIVYFGVAAWLPEGTGRSLATPIDAWIPFVPAAVLVYVSVYVGALLPMFSVQSDALFMRVVWAYCGVIAICAACFVCFPVSAVTLRPELTPLPDPSFIDWGIRVLYELDPPVNLFPSLHVALATCAAVASWMSSRSYGVYVGCWVFAVSAATCLTKQHFVVDVAAGIGLGALALLGATRSLAPLDAENGGLSDLTALTWPISLYAVFVAVFFVMFNSNPAWPG